MSLTLHKAFLLLLLALAGLAVAQNVFAREIVDMAGRKVTIPDEITRIYAVSPPGYNLLYTLAPQLLCGRAHPYRSDLEKAMTMPELRNLPVIGSVGGEGETEQADLEMLFALKPDFLLVTSLLGNFDSALEVRVQAALDRTGIPYVYVLARDLADYPAAYEFLGRLLKQEKRAAELAAYIEDALADAEKVVASVPPEKRPKVYYAEMLDGLSTENAKSFHTHLLTLAGDVNVHRESFSPVTTMGWEKISMEQIIAYNPDFILVFEPLFYQSVYKSSGWKNIKAVQNKKVLWIPRGPFNWFDRPPSFMGALGLKWLLANFYPAEYPLDVVAEARGFYRLFLNYDLTYDEMQRLIYP